VPALGIRGSILWWPGRLAVGVTISESFTARFERSGCMYSRAGRAALGRFFRYKVRFRGRDPGRCGGPRECGHSRTGTTGQERSFKNAATDSRKRPFLVAVPNHRLGFDSHHPLHFPARLQQRQPAPAKTPPVDCVLITQSSQVFVLSCADGCRQALALISQVGGGQPSVHEWTTMFEADVRDWVESARFGR